MSLRRLWIILFVYDLNTSRPQNSFSSFSFRESRSVSSALSAVSPAPNASSLDLIKNRPHYLADAVSAA